MKKFVVLALVCALEFIFPFGCSMNLVSAVENNLSEIRKNVFEGKNDSLIVSFMSGVREEPYEYNGKSEENIDFGIFTVYFNEFVGSYKVPFVATINDEKFEGMIEKHPFNESYMVDIGYVAPDDAEIIISINNGAGVVLENISSSWNVNWEQALELGKTYLNDELNEILSAGKFEAECYLKPVTDEEFISGQYFWAFSIINTNFQKYIVIFDVNSGDLLVKNKSNWQILKS